MIPNPANPQSWNRYAYVNNSPINYNDPGGHYTTYDESSTCVGEDCANAGKINYLFNHPDKPDQHGGYQEGPGELFDSNDEATEPTIPLDPTTTSLPDTESSITQHPPEYKGSPLVSFAGILLEVNLGVLDYALTLAVITAPAAGTPGLAAEVVIIPLDFLSLNLTIYASQLAGSGTTDHDPLPILHYFFPDVLPYDGS